ncbi:MAG: putative lipid II flippase FtsW [Pyrinomonadaceae bacterium]
MARKLQHDKWLFAVTVGLTLFGLVMVYSASAVAAAQENGTQYFYVMKQAVWTALGLALMLFAMNVDYHRWRNPKWIGIILSITVLALLAVFAFPRINGAHRWIRLFGLSAQPSELSKILLAVFLAWFLEKRSREITSFWLTFLPCAAVTGLLAGLILIEPDFGTSLMLGMVFLVVMFVAGARLWQLSLATVPAVMLAIGMLIFVPWRMARLVAFVDPWKDEQNTGYQVVQSLLAVGSGGVFGLGFAQGKQKLFYLPFAHSDFIFAVVGEELGLIGAVVLVVTFSIFLWRGLRAAFLAPDLFGKYLGVGIASVIAIQAFFNISVVLSLVPTKGIPLPFISYGGSSIVPALFAVGILLNISQYTGMEAEPKKIGRAANGR